MSSKKMLIVDDKLIDKLNQGRGDMSRAEFLEFCLDRCLREIQGEGTPNEEKRAVEQQLSGRDREETVYATRKDFQDLKRSVKDLIAAYIDFVTEQRPEARPGGVTRRHLEQLKNRLRAIVGEA